MPLEPANPELPTLFLALLAASGECTRVQAGEEERGRVGAQLPRAPEADASAAGQGCGEGVEELVAGIAPRAAHARRQEGRQPSISNH